MANDVVARIRAIARRRRVPKSEEKAAYETGRVESNFTNPAGGDADSQGWRQERKSIYKDPRNLDASINRFFDETAKVDHGQKSYEIAAEVQRPAAQYRGRYKTVAGEAQRLLRGGKDAGPNAPSAPTSTGATAAPSARKAALQAYVLAQGTADQPDSLMNLAHGLGAAQSAPDAKTAIKARRVKSAPSSSAGFHGSKVLELIHNDGGKGYGIKDGKTVNGAQTYAAVWAGHANHVHVAAGKKTIVALGKRAQALGLHVSENSHFGGVTQGAHVADSFHYKDEAIDASGDSKAMDKFSREVEHYNHTGELQ